MSSDRLTQLIGTYRHTDTAGHVIKFMAIFKNPMRYIRLPSHRNRHKLIYFREVTSNPQPINMFKLAVFVAILAVAFAAPGGLTGVIIEKDLGAPIYAPRVISAAPVISHGAVVVAQPVAPIVHSPPVITKTVVAGHGLGLGLGYGLHG